MLSINVQKKCGLSYFSLIFCIVIVFEMARLLEIISFMFVILEYRFLNFLFIIIFYHELAELHNYFREVTM